MWQLASLADNDTGWVQYLTVARLAERLGMSERTVQRALDELREAHALRVVTPASRHSPPVYGLCERALGAVPKLSGDTEDTPSDSEVTHVTSRGATDGTHPAQYPAMRGRGDKGGAPTVRRSRRRAERRRRELARLAEAEA